MLKEYIKDKGSFIIAEVGQNHQGDVKIAKEYIREFSNLGADAVKFQIRNNKQLFSKEAYESLYNSENSFGATYGEHREKLELNLEEVKSLKDECEKNNVKFISTPFDESSLNVLISLNVDAIKIASFDLGNLPFINRIAKTKKPVIISTGGGNLNQINDSIEILKQHKCEVAILHCVSEYPCPYDRLGLNQIQFLSKKFPDCIIGSSDHFNGTLSGPIAYMLGARIFEKHVTFNHSWKGTDHNFALEPYGFKKFSRDINRVEKMLNPKSKEDLGKEPVFNKLGKSLIANKLIKKGETLDFENLSGKIFKENYVPVRESNAFIGRKVNCDIPAGEPILLKHIESDGKF